MARVFDFSATNYDFPILKQIKIPTKIIVGEKDPCFFPSDKKNYQKAMDILLKHIPNSEGVFIPEAVHSYHLNEDLMSKEVVRFVNNQ